MRALTFRDRMREEAGESCCGRERPIRGSSDLSVCAAKSTFLIGWSASAVRHCWILLEVPQRNRTAGTFRRLAKSNGRARVDRCAGARI